MQTYLLSGSSCLNTCIKCVLYSPWGGDCASMCSYTKEGNGWLNIVIVAIDIRQSVYCELSHLLMHVNYPTPPPLQKKDMYKSNDVIHG